VEEAKVLKDKGGKDGEKMNGRRDHMDMDDLASELKAGLGVM
jgi:hypothetical protein